MQLSRVSFLSFAVTAEYRSFLMHPFVTSSWELWSDRQSVIVIAYCLWTNTTNEGEASVLSAYDLEVPRIFSRMKWYLHKSDDVKGINAHKFEISFSGRDSHFHYNKICKWLWIYTEKFFLKNVFIFYCKKITWTTSRWNVCRFMKKETKLWLVYVNY